MAGENGHFSLDVAKGDVLVCSFVGFATKEVIVGDSDLIEVLLTEQSYLLEPGAFRDKYKGKLMPPPPPPKRGNEKMLPSPPSPSSVSGKAEFYVVETMPEYKGGMERYFASLYTLVTQIGKEKGLSGLVKVEFTVNHKGEVVQVRPLDNYDSPEALEATRIVRKLDEWNPGKQRGKAVICKLVVPVEF
ncbi:MAG: energy transducer TonB [Marinilabiliaceae bacterium]|nr:energy transducer TonB [Marinilabiliaceae bacterium]